MFSLPFYPKCRSKVGIQIIFLMEQEAILSASILQFQKEQTFVVGLIASVLDENTIQCL